MWALVFNLLYVTFQLPRILRQLLHFWKIYAPIHLTLYNFRSRTHLEGSSKEERRLEEKVLKAMAQKEPKKHNRRIKIESIIK